jgi:hypothetical protein
VVDGSGLENDSHTPGIARPCGFSSVFAVFSRVKIAGVGTETGRRPEVKEDRPAAFASASQLDTANLRLVGLRVGRLLPKGNG